MFHRVLDMPLDYLGCFSVILRGIHESVDIYQTHYSIHSKLLWSHTWNCNIQANERLTKFKAKWSPIQFYVFNLSLIFFIPMSQTVSVINRSAACYFLHTPNWCFVCASNGEDYQGHSKLSVKSPRYIKCCSSSSPRPVKSPSNSIRYDCQKICSWSRKPKIILKIRKRSHFSTWPASVLFTKQAYYLFC